MKCIPLALALLFGATAQVGAAVVGITWDAQIWNIDPQTGKSAQIGTSIGGGNALAVDDRGRPIYRGHDYDRGQPILGTFDPWTGVPSQVVDLAPSAVPHDYRGLAFGDGTLYGIAEFGGFSDPDLLVSIDISTGVVSNLSVLSSSSYQSLAWRDGLLYTYSLMNTPAGGFYSIDPRTAVETFLYQPDTGLDIQALEFLPDGRLLGGRDVLYSFDLDAESYSFFTDLGGAETVDLRGLGFVQPIPLPGAGALLLIALSVLAGMAQRSRPAVPTLG